MARKPLSMAKKVLPGRISCCAAFTLVSALGLVSFLLLCTFVSVGDYIPRVQLGTSIYPHFLIGEDGVLEEPFPEAPILDAPSLIEAIRKATTEALNGEPEVEFSEAERKEWQEKNKCSSRVGLEPLYKRRKFVRHVERNAKWDAILEEYTKLHRTCIQKYGDDLTNIFLSKNSTPGCKFVVAGGPWWAGLGNKILPTVAVLLYAVLTQRVLLVTRASLLPEVICEPFEGSSWRVDPVKRFFCDREQRIYTKVPWQYFTSCLYFLPKLFAIPMFRTVLEDIFPDRMAVTHLVRSTMLPSDTVWKRVLQTNRMYLEPADRRVGIQIRYRNGETQFNQLHTTINTKFMQCAWKNGILPDVNNPKPTTLVQSRVSTTVGSRNVVDDVDNQAINNTSTTNSNTAVSHELRPAAISILVTSLFPDLHDHLTELYNRNPPSSGEVIGVVQLTRSSVQGSGVEEDNQALAEVISLSLSDHLFVSPLSTFGGLAQAYGALTPWFLEFRDNSNLYPCTRGHTVDPCYQDPDFSYFCPHDRSKFNFTGRNFTDIVPYIQKCPSIDTPNGLQLVTTPLEDIV
jgi:xyloglucan fucosyltransferase